MMFGQLLEKRAKKNKGESEKEKERDLPKHLWTVHMSLISVFPRSPRKVNYCSFLILVR